MSVFLKTALRTVVVLLLVSSTAAKAAINSLTLTQEFLNAKCLDYCIVGACVFLKCGLTGCSVNTVPKVSHNRPDLLISAVSQPGQEPWIAARATVVKFAKQVGGSMLQKMLGFSMGGGEVNPTSARNRSSTTKFKDVHIIGTPMASMKTDFFCDSHTKAFKPHLVTESNIVGWRLGADLLLPQSYIPGYREVGNFPSYTWGPIYPRHGALNQKDDAKAAAVMAQRGLSIVTEGGMGHLYQSFPADNENDTPWQRMHPGWGKCTGAPGYTNRESWSVANKSDDGMNSWLYWHRYTCCLGGRGTKIGEVSLPPVCLGDLSGL